MSHDLTALSAAVTEPRDVPPARLLGRLLGAAALVSPVALGAQYAVDPTGMLPRDDAAALLAAVAESPGRYVAATLVYLLGIVTLIGWAAVLALAARRHAPVLSTVTAVLLVIGAVAGAGFAALRLTAAALTENGAPITGATQAWTRVQDGAPFLVLAPALIAVVLATLLTAIVMLRCRRDIPVWAGPAYLAGFVLASGELPGVLSVAGGLVQAVAVWPVVRQALGRRTARTGGIHPAS